MIDSRLLPESHSTLMPLSSARPQTCACSRACAGPRSSCAATAALCCSRPVCFALIQTLCGKSESSFVLSPLSSTLDGYGYIKRFPGSVCRHHLGCQGPCNNHVSAWLAPVIWQKVLTKTMQGDISQLLELLNNDSDYSVGQMYSLGQNLCWDRTLAWAFTELQMSCRVRCDTINLNVSLALPSQRSFQPHKYRMTPVLIWVEWK